MSVKVLLNTICYSYKQRPSSQTYNGINQALFYFLKKMQIKFIKNYFSERGFHSNPALTELLIISISNRGRMPILKD